MRPSPSPGPAPADATDSRTAILDAARRLFSRDGYAGTSMADIAREAGTSVGLPYYHFGSKGAVFLAIWQEYQHQQQARTGAEMDRARAAGVHGADLLLAGMRAYLEGAWANRAIVPIAHGSEQPAGFADVMQAGAERWNEQMLALLSGYDKTLAGVAVLMLTEAHSALCLELSRCRSEKQAERLIDDGVRLTGRLLGAIPGRIRPGS